MKKIVLSLLCMTVAAISFAAKPKIETLTENLGDFTEVSASIGVRVFYTQGAVSPVKIQATADIMPYISVYKKGEKLVATIDQSKRGSNRSIKSKNIRIEISSPRIEEIECSAGLAKVNAVELRDNSSKYGAGKVRNER